MTSLFQSAKQAKQYAMNRPTYPAVLYEKILSALPPTTATSKKQSSSVCIDVGCGTGQATRALADYFDVVVGVDPSSKQIESAIENKHPNINYQVGTCEKLPIFESHHQSVDCITSAQAAHWFDLPKFYAEADRVLKPGGVLAIWTYGNMEFPKGPKELQERVMGDFYGTLLKDYWDDRRFLVENRYRDLELPPSDVFGKTERIDDGLDIDIDEWSLEQLVGYLCSWSGYATYCSRNNIEHNSTDDPIRHIREWVDENGFGNSPLYVKWPVTLLLSTKKT